MRRVLVANRGAIAARIVRACEALELESVCVYSAADQAAPYLARATATYPLTGLAAAESYLDATQLLEVLARSGADAVHPGYGFLSEDADFARAVGDAGAHFIGPAPELIRQLGDKAQARDTLAAAGLPVFPASAPVTDRAEAVTAAQAVGFPVLLKPVAGGGGIGMASAEDASAVAAAFDRCQRLAQAAFGDGRLLVERLVRGGRHIELQLVGDRFGTVRVLHERDCSVQRRHQKLLEQTPAPAVPRAEIDALAGRAAQAFADLGYHSLGTLETLWHPEQGFGVLEVNTRIQVEHAVTEAVTDIDLVALQLRLAAGEHLATLLPEVPPIRGHAIEARLYAEDWRAGYAATGVLRTFALPAMRHVRVETGYAPGQPVTPYYDPLLAKIIAWGPDRALALGRLGVALQAVSVRGVETNRDLLLGLLQHPDVRAGTVTTDRSVMALLQPA